MMMKAMKREVAMTMTMAVMVRMEKMTLNPDVVVDDDDERVRGLKS